MNLINADTKARLTSVAASVSDFAELIDASNLNMRTEANLLRDIAQDINRGMFKVLFMGKCMTGKSTLINALIGKKLMPTRATACTAIITAVEYGKDVDRVRIVYTPESRRAPEIISADRFKKNFTLTAEDYDRFADVSYAEMFSANELFADDTCLIDSPGLEEDISRTTVTNDFLPQANAIIFMLIATSLFSAKEREYIADNFAGKHMTNLFFVVNRINQLVPRQLESSVIPGVKNGLKNVFVDENGRFNEDLYKRRVFFVDACGAECVRTGAPYKIKVGNREMDFPIKPEDTGLLEFENALRNFLNSRERINATINSALAVMSSARDAAKHRLAIAKNLRRVDGETRHQKLNAARKILPEIRKQIDGAAADIAKKICDSMIAYTRETLPSAFESQMEPFKENVGWGRIMKLATMSMAGQLVNMDDELKRASEPIAMHMNAFIRAQLALWEEKSIPALIEDDLNALQKNLDACIQKFDAHMEGVLNEKNSLRNMLEMIMRQKIGTIYYRLPENCNTQVDGVGEGFGGTVVKWIVFGTLETSISLAFDIILAVILGPGSGAGIYQTIASCFHAKENLLRMTADKVFTNLTKKFTQERPKIEARIKNQFIENETIINTACGLIDDTEQTLENFATKNSQSRADIARDDAALEKMFGLIGDVRAKLS